MSTGIRERASPLPRATATTATITVNGRLMAKMIGIMRGNFLRGGPPPWPVSEATLDRWGMAEIIPHPEVGFAAPEIATGICQTDGIATRGKTTRHRSTRGGFHERATPPAA